MLTQLSISNFTIVEHMDLDLRSGLSVITGETGAGKSIAMDALTFALGAKLDPSAIRAGADQCVISATFELPSAHPACEILQGWGLSNDDNEYVFSRTLTAQGRSQARLNGAVVSLPQLKEIGPFLVDIHGQHAHQQLLKSDVQRDMLDSFAGLEELAANMKKSYHTHQRLVKEIAKLRTAQEQQQQQQDLLEYQLSELAELSPEQGEWAQLEARHTLLSQAEDLLTNHQHAQYLLNDAEEGALLSMLDKLVKITADLAQAQPDVAATHEGLLAVLAECQEYQRDLSRMADRVELDPEALQQISDRLAQYQRLAKKHRLGPDELADHYAALQEQLSSIKGSGEKLLNAEMALPAVEDDMQKAATSLTEARKEAATRLSKTITDNLLPLNMPHAKMHIALQPLSTISDNGAESVQFLFSANPGQPLAPLAQVASGGELSRVSLVLQVAVSGKQGASTLVFDEVDVGISGATASVVGKLLRTLGASTQILSITHLPQVAAFADQHFVVSKTYHQGMTQSNMTQLDGMDRVHELARLLGAQTLSAAAIANAQELLSMSAAA